MFCFFFWFRTKKQYCLFRERAKFTHLCRRLFLDDVKLCLFIFLILNSDLISFSRTECIILNDVGMMLNDDVKTKENIRRMNQMYK